MLEKPLPWIAGIVLIVTIAIGLSAWQGAETTYVTKDSEVTSSVSIQRTAEVPPALQDIDLDGLKDWEETLWNTDPRNADTDNDGTKDGEEVKMDRNPLKSGPDDVLSVSAILQNRYVPPQKASQSKRVPSVPVTPKENTVAIGTPPPSPTKESPEKAALRAYGNELAKKIKTTLDWKGEVAAFEYFLDEKSDAATGKTKLFSVADLYARRAVAIKAISPPHDFAAAHQTLQERTAEQSLAIKKIADYGNAKAVSKSEWTAYGQAVVSSGKALYDIAVLFQTKGIVFSGSEDGSIFSLPNGNSL